MAKRRHRTVRFVGVRERGRGRCGLLVTDITPGDHALLIRLLLSKPLEILALFADLQIFSLAQLEGWDELRNSAPAVAARLVAVAATLGIGEYLHGNNRERAAGDDVAGSIKQPG